MKPYILSVAFGLCAWSFVSGCAESTATTAPAEPAMREITRDVAVDTARRDAANRFQLIAPSNVMANRVGRYWVIELRSPSGGGLRYAIAVDGVIRERRTIE